MKGIKKLIIFGDGPTAEVVFDIVSEYKLFEVECFTVDKKYNKKKFIKKKKIISYEIIKKIKKKEEYVLFVSLGYSNMNKNRETIYKRAINDGFKLTNIIHPKAVIPKKTKVGKNCFIMNDVHIHPCVKIGNNNFIWSGAILCHHVKVGNNCWFTSGSSVAGITKVGNNCFFGVNASITNNLKIGNEVFIGARTLVSKSLKNKSVTISEGEKQLDLKSDQFLNLINNQF